MEHCNQDEPQESSNPTLPHFTGRDTETQGIRYLPKITQLVSGTVRTRTFLFRLSNMLYFPLYHSAPKLQTELTKDVTAPEGQRTEAPDQSFYYTLFPVPVFG